MTAATQPGSKDDLQRRLRRIEGQVRGVARMIDEDRECRDILQQLAAIRSATSQVAQRVARTYANQCLCEASGADDRAALVDDLVKIFSQTA
jgi:DNA-binding FrmR family transcriptional regulator